VAQRCDKLVPAVPPVPIVPGVPPLTNTAARGTNVIVIVGNVFVMKARGAKQQFEKDKGERIKDERASFFPRSGTCRKFSRYRNLKKIDEMVAKTAKRLTHLSTRPPSMVNNSRIMGA
jgi:hypothetical protein